MIRYDSSAQLSLSGFETPFQNALCSENRWVKLSKLVPWDKFASAYISMMNIGQGRPGVSPRIVLGALIIKHIENLDDRGVVAAIQENIYMQYFIGLTGFTIEPVFAPSLFVELRKRIGKEDFDVLTVNLIKSVSKETDTKHNRRSENSDQQEPKNKGKLQMDATVADQYITYPTDSGILNESRKKCEKTIDKLYALDDKQGLKPRTYRRTLNKAYLNYSKKKNKSKATHRKMNRKLLECLKRDLNHINKYLTKLEGEDLRTPLTYRELRMLWVVNTVYVQ